MAANGNVCITKKIWVGKYRNTLDEYWGSPLYYT